MSFEGSWDQLARKMAGITGIQAVYSRAALGDTPIVLAMVPDVPIWPSIRLWYTGTEGEYMGTGEELVYHTFEAQTLYVADYYASTIEELSHWEPRIREALRTGVTLSGNAVIAQYVETDEPEEIQDEDRRPFIRMTTRIRVTEKNATNYSA